MYQAGGASSPHDLLSQFATFLAAAGWTVDYNASNVVSIHKGTKFFTLHSFINENTTQAGASGASFGTGIAIIGQTAVYVDTGPANWAFQTGRPNLFGGTVPLDCIMFTPAGLISNYWMFADAAGDNVVLVAFKQSGVYTYLFFGTAVKPQAWVGGSSPGLYFGASSGMVVAVTDTIGQTVMPPPPGALGNVVKPVALLRADVDSFVNKWVGLCTNISGTVSSGKAMQSSTIGNPTQTTFDHIPYRSLKDNAASSRAGGLIMLPTHWLVERDFGGGVTGGGWSLAATIPWIFQCQTNGFVPGATFTISTDSYVVFPGFAIRKFP